MQDALDILADVQEKVRKMGLPEQPKPTEEPPSITSLDVGDLPNQEIETYLVKLTGYATYLLPKVAELEASYKISQANLKRVEASLKVQMSAKGTPSKELVAAVRDSEAYIAQEIEQLKLYKSYVKQAAVLSRIVELRKLEYEQAQRAHNVGHTKFGGRGTTPASHSFRRPNR
jgi:hypothetical protein